LGNSSFHDCIVEWRLEAIALKHLFRGKIFDYHIGYRPPILKAGSDYFCGYILWSNEMFYGLYFACVEKAFNPV
jgi:hypothetical protein